VSVSRPLVASDTDRASSDLRRLAHYRRSRDPAVLEELVAKYLPLARHLARRYPRGAEERGDLEQVASLGLVKAIQRFDPDRGVTFTSYAVPTILGELKRYFRDRTWSVRVPRDLQELALRVNQVSQELATELGRTPTTAEIAGRAEASAEQVLEAWEAAGAYRAISLDMQPRDEDDQAPPVQLGTEEPGYRQVESAVSLGSFLHLLSEREREILRLRFEEDLTQSEIGAQLGISQMHVSRLIRGSLTRLQDEAEAEPDAA
jgi:RNA polymerase sigma-B factor